MKKLIWILLGILTWCQAGSQTVPVDTLKARMTLANKGILTTPTPKQGLQPWIRNMIFFGGGGVIGGTIIYFVVRDGEDPQEENAPPIANCQNLSYTLAPGQTVVITPDQIDAGSSDMDGSITSLSLSKTEFTADDEGMNEVTLTVVDDDGASASCMATVLIEVLEPPQAICQPTILVLGEDGNGTLTVTDIDGGSFDNDGTLTSLEISETSFSCVDLGPTDVTLTVVDDDGLEGTCTTTVTIVDDQAPQLTCPPDQTSDTDPGACEGTVTISPPMVDDNCSVETVTNDFNSTDDASGTYPAGETVVTFTAQDASGNSANCTFTVTVSDANPPTVTCPDDQVWDNDPGDCSALVEFGPIQASDDCSTVTLTNDFNDSPDPTDTYPIGATVVLVTATDESGNTSDCSFTVTVNDTEDPVITCPNSFEVPTSPGLCATDIQLPNLAATDNCEVASITNDFTGTINPSGIYPLGNTTVEATATDAAGNTGTCSFTVTVVDAIPPTLQCPNDIQVEVPATTMNTFVNVPLPTVSDNCQVIDFFNDYTGIADASSIYPVGVTVVTWEAIDGANNSGFCSTTISVIPEVPCDILLIAEVVTYPSDSLSADGVAVVDVLGGTLPYTVLIDGNPVGIANSSSFTLSGFPLGIYILQVVDATGCFSNTVDLIFDQTEFHPSGPQWSLGVQTLPGFTNGIPFSSASVPELPGWVGSSEHPIRPSVQVSAHWKVQQRISWELGLIYASPNLDRLFFNDQSTQHSTDVNLFSRMRYQLGTDPLPVYAGLGIIMGPHQHQSLLIGGGAKIRVGPWGALDLGMDVGITSRSPQVMAFVRYVWETPKGGFSIQIE